MVSHNDLLKMTEQDRENYLVEVLQRKLNELKNTVNHSEEAAEEHRHGPEFHRGMIAGFVSGLGFATRLLAPEKAVCLQVLELLREYNDWAQNFNRRGRQDFT
ncbi:hypothetical protein [Desulforamulus putei]|nr:hypothetical protein [Desulforamulus putei]